MRGSFAGKTAEDRAGHQPGAAGVVMIKEPADDFASSKETGDLPAGSVLDLRLVRDLESAEGEGDAGRHRVGLIRRLIESLRPVGLVDRQACGAQPVENIGVER